MKRASPRHTLAVGAMGLAAREADLSRQTGRAITVRWLRRCPGCGGELGIPMGDERNHLTVVMQAVHAPPAGVGPGQCAWWRRTRGDEAWSYAMEKAR